MKMIIDLTGFNGDSNAIANKLQDILLAHSSEGHALHLDEMETDWSNGGKEEVLVFSYKSSQAIDGHRDDCPYFRAGPDCKDCECEL